MKITLFGLPGTGTTSVGKLLAHKLGIGFISTGDLFRKIARDEGIDLYEFSILCEKDLSYDKKLDQKIYSLGQSNDSFVIDSRMAWYFIKDSIKIHLTAKFNKRIERVSIRDNISFEDALLKSSSRELAERKRYYSLYKIDYIKQNKHHLKLDTTKNSVEETVNTILLFISSLSEEE